MLVYWRVMNILSSCWDKATMYVGLPRFVEWIQSNPSSKCLALRGGARARRWRLRLWIFVWPQAGTGYRTGGAFRSPTSQRITEFLRAGDQGVFCHGKQHLKHVTIEMTSQIRSKTSLLLELPNKNMFRSAVLIKSSLSSCGKQPWLGVILPQTSSRKLEVYPIL